MGNTCAGGEFDGLLPSSCARARSCSSVARFSLAFSDSSCAFPTGQGLSSFRGVLFVLDCTDERFFEPEKKVAFTGIPSEWKRELGGTVAGGNELDVVAVAGLELDVHIESEVCGDGGRNGVEVDISTWVGKGNTKGNWYVPLSLP